MLLRTLVVSALCALALAFTFIVAPLSSCDSCSSKKPAAAAAAGAAAVDVDKRYVVASVANLRASAAPDAAIVAKLPIGTAVIAAKRAASDGWLAVDVELGGAKLAGFLKADLVEKTAPTAMSSMARFDALDAHDYGARRREAERLAALAPRELRAIERLLLALAFDPAEQGDAFTLAADAWHDLARRTWEPLTESTSTWPRNPRVFVTGPGLPPGGAPYATPQQAVDAAPEGATVHLPHGVYDGVLVVKNKRDLTLLAPREPALFHASGSKRPTLKIVDSARVVVDGVFLRQHEPAGPEALNVEVSRSKDVILRHAFLSGGDVHGMFVDAGSSVAVLDCIIERYGDGGVVAAPDSDVLVHASLIDGPLGVYVYDKRAKERPPAAARIVVTHSFVSADKDAVGAGARARATLLHPRAVGDEPPPGATAVSDAQMEGTGYVEPRFASFAWRPARAIVEEALPERGAASATAPREKADCATQAGESGLALFGKPAFVTTYSVSGPGEDYEVNVYKVGDVCSGEHEGGELLVGLASHSTCVCKCDDADGVDHVVWLVQKGKSLALLQQPSSPVSWLTARVELDDGGGAVDVAGHFGVPAITVDPRAMYAELEGAPSSLELEEPKARVDFVRVDVDAEPPEGSVVVRANVTRREDHSEYYLRRPTGVVFVYMPPATMAFSGGDVGETERDVASSSWGCRLTMEQAPSSTPVGKAAGQPIFADVAGSVWLEERWNAYVAGVARYNEVLRANSVAKPREAFDKGLPRFFVDDAFGRTFECVDNAWEPPQYAEPLVYVYAREERDVDVRVDEQVALTVTAPEHGARGWSVRTRADGRLALRGAGVGVVVDSLFWEGTHGQLPAPDEASFVVERTEVLPFLDDKLAYLGLLPHEIDDFVAHWFPRLTESPWVRVAFVPQALVDVDAPLWTEPPASVLLRVHIDWTPLASRPVDAGAAEPPLLEPGPARDSGGVVVVEWSGFERGYAPSTRVAAVLGDDAGCRAGDVSVR